MWYFSDFTLPSSYDYLVFKEQYFKKLVESRGIEPLTSCVQGRRSPS